MEWINIDDKLPDNQEKCFVAHKYGFVYAASYTFYGEFLVTNIESRRSFFPKDQITHWMPLPEPPDE